MGTKIDVFRELAELTLSSSLLGSRATLGRSDDISKELRAVVIVGLCWTLFLDFSPLPSSAKNGFAADVSRSAERRAAVRLMPSMLAPPPCRFPSPSAGLSCPDPNRFDRLLRRGLRAETTSGLGNSESCAAGAALFPLPTPNRPANRPKGDVELC